MTSIRKIKRRAMARQSDPRLELRFEGVTLALLRGMPTIQRETFIRAACKDYIKHRATPTLLLREKGE